jgi:hypothetical protein
MEESDDERLDRVFTQLRALQAAHEAVVIGGMEVALDSTPAAPSAKENRAPAPGDWHPYYETHRAWLLNWLDHESGQRLVIPVPRTFRLVFTDEPIGLPEPVKTTNLTRQRAWGLAPYVGEPFIYMWPCASDERGRWIAGSVVMQRL